MEAQKHVCGVCHDEWLTEEEYLNHVCPQTSATPQQAEHLINSTTPEFASIATAALERGAEVAQANGDEVQVARNQEAIEQLNGTPEVQSVVEQPTQDQPTISLQ